MILKSECVGFASSVMATLLIAQILIDLPGRSTGAVFGVGQLQCNFTPDQNHVSLQPNFTQSLCRYTVSGEGIECETPCPIATECLCTISEDLEKVNVTISAFNTSEQIGQVVAVVAKACSAEDLGTTRMAANNSVAIENGLALYNDTAVEAVAMYQCDSGYTLSGDERRTCQCDGSWSGSIPKCTAPGTSSVNLGVVIGVPVAIIIIVVLSMVIVGVVCYLNWEHIVSCFHKGDKEDKTKSRKNKPSNKGGQDGVQLDEMEANKT